MGRLKVDYDFDEPYFLEIRPILICDAIDLSKCK